MPFYQGRAGRGFSRCPPASPFRTPPAVASCLTGNFAAPSNSTESISAFFAKSKTDSSSTPRRRAISVASIRPLASPIRPNCAALNLSDLFDSWLLIWSSASYSDAANDSLTVSKSHQLGEVVNAPSLVFSPNPRLPSRWTRKTDTLDFSIASKIRIAHDGRGQLTLGSQRGELT